MMRKICDGRPISYRTTSLSPHRTTPRSPRRFPVNSFSSVPYEKGFNFLYYLEQLLGGPAVFEPYVKAYYTHFANQSVGFVSLSEKSKYPSP